MATQTVLLCDFHPTVGWRCRAVSQSDRPHFGIVKIGAIKLLRLPTQISIPAGRFCNPRHILHI